MKHWRSILVGVLLVGVLAGWFVAGRAPDDFGTITLLPSLGAPHAPGQTAAESSLTQNPALPDGTHPHPSIASAMDAIEAEEEATVRVDRMDALVGRMAPAEGLQAFRLLEEKPLVRWSGEWVSRLVRRWAESDPSGAGDWATRMPPGPARQQAVREVAIAWADRALSESVAWVRQLPEEDRAGGLLAVAYEAARQAPLEALKLALELAPDKEREELIACSIRQWAALSPQAAADWAGRIEDPALREQALMGIAITWGESDPRAAAELALDRLPAGRAQEDAVVGIVQHWAQREPERAAAWVAEFPAGSLRDAAMDNLVKLWADQDANDAAKWLNRLGAGPGRDLALESFIDKIAPSFPETAVRWAESIGDDARRLYQLERVGEDWLQSDSPAAQAWIAQAPLPEAAKIRLLGARAN